MPVTSEVLTRVRGEMVSKIFEPISQAFEESVLPDNLPTRRTFANVIAPLRRLLRKSPGNRSFTDSEQHLWEIRDTVIPFGGIIVRNQEIVTVIYDGSIYTLRLSRTTLGKTIIEGLNIEEMVRDRNLPGRKILGSNIKDMDIIFGHKGYRLELRRSRGNISAYDVSSGGRATILPGEL